MPATLTPEQLEDIAIIERVNSILSLLGCTFIIATFLCSHKFRRPINRLICYASFGNIMANGGTLISRAGISNVNGALCQTQGFLIQMFLCADVLWSLAMACNVYLTFFHKFDAEKLRTMEKYYFAFCYGLPMIPALILLFLRAPKKSKVYGDATLWCWISHDWDILRIAMFYGPIWVSIFVTFLIYGRAGTEIYKKRKQLRNFQQLSSDPHVELKEPFASTKTTEVHVTSESITDIEAQIDLAPLGDRTGHPHGRSPPSHPAYSVSVSSQQVPPAFHDAITPTPSRPAHHHGSGGGRDFLLPPHAPAAPSSNPMRRHTTMEANKAAWSYTKVAVLFFTALLVTWIPSSANRVYSVIHPQDISTQLQFASSFVLPLQGFWNAIIYAATSWSAVVALFRDVPRRCSPDPTATPMANAPIVVPRRGNPDRNRDLEYRSKSQSSLSSTAELASRPASRSSDI